MLPSQGMSLNASRAGGETHHSATGYIMEGLEHGSGHSLDVLPEDTMRLVERCSELVRGKVIISIAVEVGESRGVDNVVPVCVVGSRSDGVRVPNCCSDRAEDCSSCGTLTTVEVITESLILEEASHLADARLVSAT